MVVLIWAFSIRFPVQYSKRYHEELPPEVRAIMDEYVDSYFTSSGGTSITHGSADAISSMPRDSEFRVARTMFETDRITPLWAELCNRVDEVWVPSQFNVDTFSRSGVALDKLKIVPGAVDPVLFDPRMVKPLGLENKASYNFLSIFEWQERKAWNVLLGAYLREFTCDDDVCLWLRSSKASHILTKLKGGESLPEQIESYARELGLNISRLPRIEILSEPLPLLEMPSLYKAMDCLVGISRGEGWGRPQHEAMLMELPVIASNWSGNTEFMHAGNSFLVDSDIIPVKNVEKEMQFMKGHFWAHPSEEHTREYMRRMFENPEGGRRIGQIAREEMCEKFSPEPVSKIVMERLLHAQDRVRTRKTVRGFKEDENLAVHWEGSFLDYGSLSHVNRNLISSLEKFEDIKISVLQSERRHDDRTPEPLEGWEHRTRTFDYNANPDVTIRHGWPPNWGLPERGGKLVTIQPFEFGVLPCSWVEGLKNVDEAWVPSTYVKKVYEDSGVPADKVVVIPNGIDESVFNPEAPPIPIRSDKKFKFLFVGGTIRRKGPDVLLKAFIQEFKGHEDVSLVIKDFGGKAFYPGQTFEETIRMYQDNPLYPEIIYMDDDLSPQELVGLYTACDCLVHPYRGEGFGLPVLEAMACGLPVICTGGGATDDFATDEFAFRIPSKRFSIPPKVGDKSSGKPLVADGWMIEPDLKSLKSLMRHVFADQPAAAEVGTKAAEHVRNHWTWRVAANLAEKRLRQIAAQPSHNIHGSINSPEYREQKASRKREQSALLSLQTAMFSHTEMECTQQALNAVDWGVCLTPNSVELLKYRGWLNVQAERWNEARVSYDRLIELGETEVINLLPAAICEFKIGNRARAIQHWRRVMEMEPDNELAKENLTAMGEPVSERDGFASRIQ